MQVSIVKHNNIEKMSLRMDAEYYQPHFLENDRMLLRKKWKSLAQLTKDIKSFGAYSLCNLIEYKDKGIPFLRCQNIKNGFVDFSNVLYIDQNTNRLLWKSEIKPNTVLLTMSGTVGNATVAVNKLPYPINSNQDIAKISVNNEKICPFYLAIFLNSRFGKTQTERLPIGSIQQHIFLWQLQRLIIPIFSTRFQSVIRSTYLKALSFIDDAEIFFEQAEALLLSELGLTNWCSKHQLTFVKNFSETQQAERIDAEYFQPKYDEIVDAIKICKGGWDTLENLVKIEKSIEPGSDAYQESGVPFVRVSNLSKFEITNNNQQYISEELYQDLIKYQPEQNEILLSKDATPGIAFHLKDKPGRMIPSGGILRLTVRNSERLLGEYLALVLNSTLVQQQMLRDAGGSIIKHWRLDQVKNTFIPILGEEIQKKIKSNLEASFDCRKKSKWLLEIAKQGVEIAIEQNEKTAEEWMKIQADNLGINLSAEE